MAFVGQCAREQVSLLGSWPAKIIDRKKRYAQDRISILAEAPGDNIQRRAGEGVRLSSPATDRLLRTHLLRYFIALDLRGANGEVLPAP